MLPVPLLCLDDTGVRPRRNGLPSGGSRRDVLLVPGVFSFEAEPLSAPFLERVALFLEVFGSSDSVSESEDEVSESDDDASLFAVARRGLAGVVEDRADRAALLDVPLLDFVESRRPPLAVVTSASLGASVSAPLLLPSPEESELVMEADLDLEVEVDLDSGLETRSTAAAAAAA